MARQFIYHMHGLNKAYNGKKVLDNIHLSFYPDAKIGILGPNGAGKSTLFQICSGLFSPDGGTVRLFGMDYKDQASEILKRLGVVFQSRSLDLDMSVRANLKFHGNLFGLSGKLLNERIDAAAAFFAVTELIDKPVRTLSGGNQRRIEIVRATLNMPSLLLMDEPSVGLDPTTRKLLGQHIRGLRETHQTSILWATHLVEEVEQADRIALIVAGRIIRIGTPAEIIAAAGTETLGDAYIALTGVKPAASASAD